MGYLLTESGGHLDTEAAGHLLDEAGALPFPEAPLDLRSELNLAGTWTDVSAYAYQRDGTQAPVKITRGRPDESSQANPGVCTWEWNNRDGRFSPKNPLSPYYGLLGRNTPVRWSVPAKSSYLRLENSDADRAFVQPNSTLNIAGSIELRMALRLTDWRAAVLACKFDGGGCWLWELNDDGTMLFGWYDSGAVYHAVTSTAPVPYTSGDFALRITMDATTGNVSFYAAAAIDGTYTQIGTTASGTSGAATSIQVAASPLVAGYSFSIGGASQLVGRVYELRMYSGIGGTIAADGVFSAQAAGAASWTDSAGNLWQVAGGGEVSDRDYRFHGEMSAQPPKWDVTGRDMAVMAQAGGPLRRLRQGTNNVTSAMKRAITAQSGALYPVAYWPMEDASGAAVFGAAIGSQPLAWAAGPPSLSADSSFLASAPLPTLGTAVLSANLPSYTGGTAWALRFAYKPGTAPAAQARLLAVATTGACSLLEVLVDTDGTLSLGGWLANGTQVISVNEITYPQLSGPAYWSLEATPSGSDVEYALVAVAPGASTGSSASSVVTGHGSFGNVLSYQFNSDGALHDTVVGQVQVQSAWASLFTLGAPLNAWQQEKAADRYARLANENGYRCRILGSPAYSAAMGPQGQATLDALLQECEAADMGQQYEPRQQLALGYRTLASMCSQSPRLTLDYTAGEPGGVSGDGTDSGLDPAYDDLLSKNDWTVTRGASSGSQGATVQVQLADGSAMSTSAPPDGIGDYANTQTVNVAADSQLPDVAGWLVHLGTVDELRWPAIPLNLARTEMSSLYYDALDTDAGDMVEVASLPDAVLYDPVKQLALGFKESLGGFHHTAEFNAVPASPYDVIILDDPVLGRVDTDGSTLASSATAGATTLSVATVSGFPLWTTTAADFPFDAAIAGERVTVTNITGSSSPQSFTVTRSVNGVAKAQSSGADVRLWTPPILAVS